MPSLFLVMLGGAIGAGGRHLLSKAALVLAGPDWPWGTFAANILGGLAMGLLVGTLARNGGSDDVRLFLGVGLLGGFTTFSAFSLETMLMIERGQWGGALFYALASVILSVGALALGLGVMRATA